VPQGSGSEFTDNYGLVVWLSKPLRQFDIGLANTLVAIAIDRSLVRAFAKNGEIIFSHEESMFGEFWNLVFELVHRLRSWNLVGQVSEEIAKHFHFQELMDPDLMPRLSLQVSISKAIRQFLWVQSKVWIVQK